MKQEAKQREAKQASRSKTRETQPLWGCVSLAKGKPWPVKWALLRQMTVKLKIIPKILAEF